MLRRSFTALGGGMVPFHDWTIRDPILQNYEGWRVLDNVKVTRWESMVTDWGGFGRHLDPIIDDPRLTHSQRVCRMYRWSLKELIMHTTWQNTAKTNLGIKTIRMRYEKYRYVTDPAMCDMMIRETQKYLRETCSAPTVYYYDYRWKNQPLQGTLMTGFPGHPQCYDHWTDQAVFHFDDLKIHRYFRHWPHQTAPREAGERFGDATIVNFTGKTIYRPFITFFLLAYFIGFLLSEHAFLHNPDVDPPHNWKETTDKYADMCMRASYEYHEKTRAHKMAHSYIDYDWDWVMGKVGNRANAGNFQAMQRHRLDRSETEDVTYY